MRLRVAAMFYTPCNALYSFMRRSMCHVAAMCRRAIVPVACLLLLLPCIANAANSFTLPPIEGKYISYPLRDISLILPAGIPAQDDLCLPQIMPVLRKFTKRLLVPTIRSGRGGSYAINELLREPADGYTLALYTIPSLILQTYNTGDALYTLNDVTPITVMGQMPLALWVAETSPYTTLEEFLQFVRSKGPGEVYIAGSGRFTGAHMASFILNREAGVITTFAPQISTKGCMEAVLDGKAQAMWAAGLAPETLNGMRPLAVTSEAPQAVLPSTPTFTSQGLDIIHTEYLGLVVLATTSVKQQQDAAAFFTKLVCDEEFQTLLRSKGITPVTMPFEEIPRFIEQQEAILERFTENYPMFE